MRLIKHLSKQLCFILLFLLLAGSLSYASNTAKSEKSESPINIDVKEFYLENGLQFLIVERKTTPQVACRLAIRAGSAFDLSGKTGVAHLLEHMMFKGTKNFGTLDIKKDQELQDRIEAAYQIISKEKGKRNPDLKVISKNEKLIDKLRLEVQKIYVPQAFSSQLGKNGAVNVNAFTTSDETQYTMSIPSDMIEQWFSIVSEQIFEPSWREFYVEREVIQREWAFRYVNNPSGIGWLDLRSTAFTAHPYGVPVIGWKWDMAHLKTQDAKDFHKKYYSPANSICVLVGDITVEKAKKLAQIYFDRYPAGVKTPDHVTKEPIQQGPRKSIRYLKGARTPLVKIGYHGAPMGTKDFYALDAMTMILSYGRSSRFTREIINKGLAMSAWAHNPDNRYGSLIVFGGSPNEPDKLKAKNLSESKKSSLFLKACEELENILMDEVEKMKKDLVSSKELARIKKLNERDFFDRMRTNEKLASTLATLEVKIGWDYLVSYLRQIDKVSPEDIQRAVKKYINENNKTSVYVIPGGKPDKPHQMYTEVRSSKGFATDKTNKSLNYDNISIYSTPDDWKHPQSFQRHPEKIIYPKAKTAQVNSAKVFYLPDRELPLIDLTILVKAGDVDIDKKKNGLATLLNHSIIRGGTKNYSPDELARVLDNNAIQISVSVGEEFTRIGLSVMKKDWEKGLSLLKEILTEPRFDSKILKVIKKQTVMALKRQGENAQSVVGREWSNWHFKGHPYGRDPLEAINTIGRVKKKDLKEFLKAYFVPSNMIATIAGDITESKAIAGLKELFQALPQTKAPERKLDRPKPNSPVLVLINKPGQVQSQILMGLPGVLRTNPDFWRLNLLMSIFGGQDSLMYKRLRDDLGLVYSAGFYQNYKWKAGYLVGYIGCKADKTVQAILETVNIIKKLHMDVPKHEFEFKKIDALNSFVFNVDTPSELVEVYGRYSLRNEPLDTLERIQDDYMAANSNDLLSLAQSKLNPSKLQIFIVGDKSILVKNPQGKEISLEEDLKLLADKLGLDFKEMPLR